jgi:hypothetical protein
MQFTIIVEVRSCARQRGPTRSEIAMDACSALLVLFFTSFAVGPLAVPVAHDRRADICVPSECRSLVTPLH